MFSKRRMFGLIGGLVVLGLAVAVVARRPWAPEEVTLTYVGGTECVTIEPDELQIFKPKVKNLFKPKRVRWAAGEGRVNSFRREIEYARDKGRASGNHLGPVDPIACTGPQITISERAPRGLPPGDVFWPYRVIVSDCEKTELCRTDPIIIIKD